MHSAVYTGTIRHRRFRPVDNRFQYRIFFMFLDLDELDHVFDGHPFWSVERFNLAAFRRRDHIGDPKEPLDRTIRGMVEAETGERPQGPIRILTHLRYFGYCFNPVSFYYCYARDGRTVEAVVAEVRNTPWLETHCYVLGRRGNEHPDPSWRRHRLDKIFHVSPFMDMNVRYDWRFRMPGERLQVYMINYSGGKKLFDASLSLERREISRASLNQVVTRYPWMTAKVTLMIYRQAFRLWRKRTPFYAHPEKATTFFGGGVS
jgi:DUF1365 family protein